MRPTKNFIISFCGIFLFIFISFLLRSTGIHIDENNYLAWASNNPLGDATTQGKPVFFYLFNFVIWNTFGWLLGPWQPFSLHLANAFLLAISLTLLSFSWFENTKNRLFFLSLGILTPFFIFNSTQVMMETLLFSLINLGLIGLHHRSRMLMTLAFGGAVLIKSTTIPVVFILLFVFRKLKKEIWPLGISLVAAIILTQIIQKQLLQTSGYDYGGVSALFDANHFFQRILSAPSYLWLWLFYVGPLQISILLFLKRTELLQDRYFQASLLSMLFTVGIGLASHEDFARYCYPLIWLGILFTNLLLVKAVSQTRLWRWALIVPGIFFSLNIWTDPPFSLWPSMIGKEAYHNGYTVLPEIPIYRWFFFHPFEKENLCVLLPQDRSEKPWAAAQIISILSGDKMHSHFFPENQIENFKNCNGLKWSVRRQYQEKPETCQPACYCRVQEMKGWATFMRPLTNETCLSLVH